MKASVRTWRYNFDSTIDFHGAHIHYDPSVALLTVEKPVLEWKDQEGRVTRRWEGLLAGFTIVSGDEFIVDACDSDCEFHKEDRSGVLPQIIITQ